MRERAAGFRAFWCGAREARTSGRRVQMPELRGRKSRPTTASSTEDLPALWPPTATTCGSVSHRPGRPPGLPPTTLLSPAMAQAFCSRLTSSSKRLRFDIAAATTAATTCARALARLGSSRCRQRVPPDAAVRSEVRSGTRWERRREWLEPRNRLGTLALERRPSLERQQSSPTAASNGEHAAEQQAHDAELRLNRQSRSARCHAASRDSCCRALDVSSAAPALQPMTRLQCCCGAGSDTPRAACAAIAESAHGAALQALLPARRLLCRGQQACCAARDDIAA